MEKSITQPASDEVHHDYAPLTEFQGSLKHPPQLTFEDYNVEPYSIDWKSESHHEFSDRTGEPPTKLLVTNEDPVQFVLSGSILPTHMQVAVYQAAASQIDPRSKPDHALICTDINEKRCRLEIVRGVAVLELSRELFPNGIQCVLGMSAEYLAPPELNSDRFTNLINWVIELSHE